MSEEIDSDVTDKYEILDKLGKGAYGIVWKAIDRKTKLKVAIKKIYEAFRNVTDAQRTYREIMYLQNLKNHENIVKLLKVIKAKNNNDLYMVFEIMETDLHKVIRYKVLSGVHKRYVMYQLFKVLKFIHSADIVHRDLKPSNILINSDCLIKVADFGLARSIASNDKGTEPIISDYIATRWYRAPEIVLGSQKYSKSVDMWSAGCIFGELLLGKVLFPGKSSLNQMELIVQLLGRPTQDELWHMKISHSNTMMRNVDGRKSKSFADTFNTHSAEAVDLLRKLLVYNPERRLTVDEALKHPYFTQFHNPKEEITCKNKITIPINDNDKYSINIYRDAIYKNINQSTANNFGTRKRTDCLPALNKSRTTFKIVDKGVGKPYEGLSKTRLTNNLHSKAESKENVRKLLKHKSIQILSKQKQKHEDGSHFKLKNDILKDQLNRKLNFTKTKTSYSNIIASNLPQPRKKDISTDQFPRKINNTYSINVYPKEKISPFTKPTNFSSLIAKSHLNF